jgi:hypothetical protein
MTSRSTQKIACGLPIDMTEGECRTDRRSGRSAARCGWCRRILPTAGSCPIRTPACPCRPRSFRPHVRLRIQDAGDGLEGEDLLAGFGRQRLHDAARAVATGLRLRAVGIEDVDEGVGALGLRIVDGHDLVELGLRMRIQRDRSFRRHLVLAAAHVDDQDLLPSGEKVPEGRMRGRFGIEGRSFIAVFSQLSQFQFARVFFFKVASPPSSGALRHLLPAGGEEGDRGPLNTSSHARKIRRGFACIRSLGRGAGKCRDKVILYDAFRRPVQCLLPRFSGSSALSFLTGKPPMPRPGRLSARPFNAAGFSPGPSAKTAWPTRHARSAFTNRRRTAFHAAPGISRAFRQTIRAPAPPRRQRKPVYP